MVLTTNTESAIVRGFSPNQVIPLQHSLVVPAATTFYWNGEGSVVSVESYPCSLQPGRPTFE